jgi:CheY-like chemotaxis protein
MRALVVDDNDAFRALVSALLRDLAAVVEQADGETRFTGHAILVQT